VPASAEIEERFGEFTGYVSDVQTPQPTMRVTCITHRRDPTLESTLPGSYSENSVMSSIQRAAIAWNILTAAGTPGIRDFVVPPITNGVNIIVRIKKAYQGQPKQIAAALWGNSAAQYRYKHVTVVEEDIDASSYEQVDWAFAHRVNAGEDGIVIFPGILGSPIDPRTPMHDRDVSCLGTGLWNRVLIDATRSWKMERRVGRGALSAYRAPRTRGRGARPRAPGRVRPGRPLVRGRRPVVRGGPPQQWRPDSGAYRRAGAGITPCEALARRWRTRPCL
jgi:3-polyprenyl-4-hydroxybenzoate decarboxylase